MNRIEAIKQHYLDNWRSDPESSLFDKGPVRELPAGFRVLLFPPRAGREMWTYATCGMSSPSDESQMELHIFSPKQSESIVEILHALAHFHHNKIQCNLWHTVNFGRPWLESSICSFGLISLPYLDGPALENFEYEDSTIKFYWLIPVTKSEVDFKRTAGIEALEEKFEDANLAYWDPSRSSLV
ncbi:MAG: suppressor of fused domain protein [Akkermansiaceae bacterium]|nr:suppressor of fused domain protein [Akkermansiaceae bacterium]